MTIHHFGGTCRTTITHLGVTLGKVKILHDINFSLNCGELTVLIGPNGAGKTTLLKALLGEVPHSGSITFHEALGRPRKLQVGYVPQKINIEKNSPVSVYDLFASFLTKKPVFLRKNKTTAKSIQEQLAQFDVAQHIESRLCDLSGGELQRVMLALAVVPIPEVLILDEPVSGIDRNGLTVFYDKLIELKQKKDITILLVSHDLQLISSYADRVMLLNKTILAQGEPDSVLKSSAFLETFSHFVQREGI